MGEVVGRESAYHWTVNRLAEATGRDRRTINAVIRDAAIAPAGTTRGNTVYRLSDIIDALLSRQRDTAAGPDDMTPTDRRAWYQSETERVRLECQLRTLVPADEVQREMSSLAKAVAGGLDSLADMLERDAGLEPEAIDLVERVTDALREQMYLAITDDADEA